MNFRFFLLLSCLVPALSMMAATADTVKVINNPGKVTVIKKNGEVFEGDFRNGLFDGQMIIHYHDGSRFRGYYRKGVKHGRALEESRDGKRFEGNYENGTRVGEFVEKDRNGQVTAHGVYRNGQRILQ